MKTIPQPADVAKILAETKFRSFDKSDFVTVSRRRIRIPFDFN